MRNDYIITIDDATTCLNMLSNDIEYKYEKNGINVNFIYNENLSRSVTSSNPVLPPKNVNVMIGVKYLFDEF